jgi:hypothetical protein
LQQQNFSLSALNKRDQGADPFGTKPPSAPQLPKPEAPPAPTKAFDDLDFAAIAVAFDWESKRQLAA